LVAGLLVVAAAAYVRKDLIDPAVLKGFGVGLIALGLAAGLWNFWNALAEQREQATAEFTLFQIERLLGLHDEVPPDVRWPITSSKYPYMFQGSHILVIRRATPEAGHSETSRGIRGRFRRWRTGADFGDKVIAAFQRDDSDAPSEYAKIRSGNWGGSRRRLAAASFVLGISPMLAGGLLIYTSTASGNRVVEGGEDIKSLKTLSAVIDSIERSDAAIHAELMSLVRRLTESSAVRKGTLQVRPDK